MRLSTRSANGGRPHLRGPAKFSGQAAAVVSPDVTAPDNPPLPLKPGSIKFAEPYKALIDARVQFDAAQYQVLSRLGRAPGVSTSATTGITARARYST